MLDMNVRVTHRVSIEDVLRHYSTPQAAFDAGDFTACYRLAKPGSRLWNSAAILCGLAEDNRDQDTSETLYSTLGSWIEDDHKPPTWLARRWRVVIMGTVSLQILPYLKRVPHFEVITAGYADHYDVRLAIDDAAETLQAKLGPIDLAISLGAEEFSLPSCYAQMPFPKMALFLDSDLTLTCKHAQMQTIDALITFTSTDHFEVRRMYGKPTFTIPNFTYTPDAVKSAGAHKQKTAAKTTDILFTGYARDPFFQRKAQFLFQLAMLPDPYQVLINHNTYRLSLGEYLDRLASAYLVPTFIRWHGAMNTRAMEALAVGSRVLVQRGSFLCDFLGGTEAGLHSYSYETLAQDVAAALKHAQQTPAPEQNIRLRQLYEPQRMAGYFLKVCAFLAHTQLAKKPAAVPSTTPLCTSGMAFENESDRAGFNRAVMAASTHAASLKMHINACVAGFYNLELGSQNAYAEAKAVTDRAIKHFPDSLMLHFHAGRLAFHYSPEPTSASPHFRTVLTHFQSMTFDPIQHDIGNGMLIQSMHFPYMLYLDNLIESGIAGSSGEQQARRMLASAAAMYLGLIQANAADQSAADLLAQALQLAPDNWCAHAQRVRLLAGQKATASSLLDSYRLAVAGFPFLIHDLIVPALQAHLALKQRQAAKLLLTTWFRFYRRMRYNFECLPLPDALVQLFQQQPDLFPPTAHKVFKLLLSLPANVAWSAIPPLEAFEADVLTANFKARFQSAFRPEESAPQRRDLAPLLLYAAACAAEHHQAERVQQLLTTYFDTAPRLPEHTKALQLVRAVAQQQAHIGLALYRLLLDQGFDREWLLLYEMAECHADLQQPEAALTLLQQALAIFPDFIKAQKKRAALQATITNLTSNLDAAAKTLATEGGT